MEEVSDTAVLVTSSSPASLSTLASQSQPLQAGSDPHTFPQKQAADSLIQVIQKLSKIVEKRPQRCRTLAGQKRLLYDPSSKTGSPERRGESFAQKKIRKTGQDEDSIVDVDCNTTENDLCTSASGDSNNNISSSVTETADNPLGSDQNRTVTCYQCSLCPYLAPTLSQLREHLKQHNEQHSDLILMCSECHFTSTDHEQLETHVKLHLNSNDGSEANDTTENESSSELAQKKWYSYEEYGLYRCLICSYVCSQQRMLKTHAWKHAGLVDCTYPIFEEEEGKTEAQSHQVTIGVSVNPTASKKELVVLSSDANEKSGQIVPSSAFKVQQCIPLSVEDDKKEESAHLAKIAIKAEEKEKNVVFPIKDEESEMVMLVSTNSESCENPSDSLLSSAQKIINSSPNSAGHINVIVERLPSAGDSVLTTNPLLCPDEDGDKSIDAKEHNDIKVEQNDDIDTVESAKADSAASPGVDKPRDENVPPSGRKRTHSESLRLHSLAAEALVAMPMRTPELSNSASKAKNANSQIQMANPGQKVVEEGSDGKAGVVKSKREQSLGSLGEGDEESSGTKAGISLSLLTVIERLRERSDQNASDDDILKELQDNAQSHNGALGDAVTANGTADYMDGLVTSSDNSLVDYIQGSERPYRCRLCQYTSGNKGYMKQHLRVHKQREPYQCPICEHIALNSKDLESHMMHHCKSRMHPCKLCPESFHYKCHLRTHEKQCHSPDEASGTDKVAKGEEAYQVTDVDTGLKIYKCDMCEYTSYTYIGVRNHRRIHNLDKPYRCCSCDFATTNMYSLKNHMRRHPQEHQAVQLLEQYRCSLCGYVCSHPPSLKSHMWKHAGDQNYNYEQVNKAINEAISQSSRATQKSSIVKESSTEQLTAASLINQKSSVEQPSVPSTALDLSVDVSAAPTDQLQGVAESLSPQGRDTQQPQAAEYCLLLFCCCICGFESTSKERLLEHMKDHEGDLISIILNKDQPLAEPHANLQIAE